jgi:uncharacterized protein (TIGR02246 family)
MKTFQRPLALALFCILGPTFAQSYGQEPKPEGAKQVAPVAGSALIEPSTTLSDRPEDEKAVRAVLRAMVQAYNDRKAEAIGALLLDNALLVDPEGAETEGRKAIEEFYRDAFSDGECDQIQGAVEGVRFHGADAVSLRGQFQLVDQAGSPTAAGRFRIVAQRKDQRWQLAEIQDYAVERFDFESNYEHLQQLEWMVGEWVDESQDVKLATQVRWDDSRNFLVRTYALQVSGEQATTGTQIIGWDPRARQIRSWVFDSQGGFGEGTWLAQDNRWVVKATGVLRDGRTTSATQVVEMLNNDAIRLTSHDRTVGDESIPDVADVLMVRKAPEPEAANSSEKPERAPATGASKP